MADPAAVARAADGAEVVFHLAALASVQHSVENPLGSHQACATGTLHVLDAAAEGGVRRVVYAASTSAYGIPAGDVQTEDDPLRPLSPYAAAKLAGELYCQAFAASYGLETVVCASSTSSARASAPTAPTSGVIALFAPRSWRGGRRASSATACRRATSPTSPTWCRPRRGPPATPGVAGRTYNVGTGRGTNCSTCWRH